MDHDCENRRSLKTAYLIAIALIMIDAGRLLCRIAGGLVAAGAAQVKTTGHIGREGTEGYSGFIS